MANVEKENYLLKVGFPKINRQNRDCRARYLNTSFWSHVKVTLKAADEPSMHTSKCRINELTGFVLYNF